MKKKFYVFSRIVALCTIVVSAVSFTYAQSSENDMKAINNQNVIVSKYITISDNIVDKTLIAPVHDFNFSQKQSNITVQQHAIKKYDNGQMPVEESFSGFGENDKSMLCDYFTTANSTTVPDWTEQVGDWAIYNNQLQSPSVADWHYITYNGSSQANGYVSCTATCNGSLLQFIGVVGRYASTGSYIMAKIQGSTSWTDIYIYCDGISVFSASGSYGNNAKIKMEYSGANVILMIDTDQNGIWDYTYATTVTNTGLGLCGVGSYNQCYIDNWCYGAGYDCTPPAAPTSVTATPSLICAGSSSILSASSAVDTINWYVVPAGGFRVGSVASGSNFIVSPGTTTTYYAEAQTEPNVVITLATGTVTQGSVTLPCTTGTNAGGVVWNPQYSLYYGFRVGNSSFPMFTYSASGTLLNTSTIGIDIRGSWWNSNTNKYEANGYSAGGYRTIDLDANGYALSTGIISPAGQNQPDAQSMGGYDPMHNETVFYNAGSIYRYNRTTGALVASGAITGLPSGSINSYWAAYSGVTGAEIMLYDYTNRAVRFINRLTFAYTASVQLDASAPVLTEYNIGYDGNKKLWLYNGSTAWVSYQIININGCVSASRRPVIVTVDAVPAPPTSVTATPSTLCSGSSSNLNATAAVNTINWYTVMTGGSSIGSSTSGSNFLVSPASSTTYYAEAQGDAHPTITTTYDGINSFNGNMFDVNVLQDIVVKSFDVHSEAATLNYEIYYKTGTWVGFDATPGAWTLIGSANNIVGNGNFIPTPLNLNLNLALSAGQTYAFYVTNTSGTMHYTTGTGVGNICASNAQLEIKEGWGGGYPFINPNIPREWNGTINYEVPNQGCMSIRTPITLTVNPTPPAPVITLAGNILTSDAPSGNQWYFNNALLPGATNQTYTVLTNGTYYDIVSIGGCTSDTSNVISATVGIEENQEANSVIIYPNPIMNEMTIIYSKGIEKIEVYDVTGKLIIRTDCDKLQKVDLDVARFASGIYTIRINGSLVRKVMK